MSWWSNFKKTVKGPQPPPPPEEKEQEAYDMETFRSRVSAYRSSFNPMQRRAPNYDYVNWKPHGTIRDENPPHTYVATCMALGDYVQGVVESGMAGREEQMFVGVTGQATGHSKPPSRQISRAASREVLNASREGF